MRRPTYEVGTKVQRAELRPFEVDGLIVKLRKAIGHINRCWAVDYDRMDGFYWKYEVLWKWPNGETCLTHHTEDELTASINLNVNLTQS